MIAAALLALSSADWDSVIYSDHGCPTRRPSWSVSPAESTRPTMQESTYPRCTSVDVTNLSYAFRDVSPPIPRSFAHCSCRLMMS